MGIDAVSVAMVVGFGAGGVVSAGCGLFRRRVRVRTTAGDQFYVLTEIHDLAALLDLG